jgi:hypothetical protein
MTSGWYHTFDAWGAQALHRAKSADDAITQHLLHWGLLEGGRIHTQAHMLDELLCPEVFLALDPKTRPERCTGDHSREWDEELGDWHA